MNTLTYMDTPQKTKLTKKAGHWVEFHSVLRELNTYPVPLKDGQIQRVAFPFLGSTRLRIASNLRILKKVCSDLDEVREGLRAGIPTEEGDLQKAAFIAANKALKEAADSPQELELFVMPTLEFSRNDCPVPADVILALEEILDAPIAP